MPPFRYRAMTRAGEVVLGEVEAPSREEVIRRIEYLGHLPIDAELATKGMLARARRLGAKLPRPRELTPIWAVSESRISPTMITSGSWRKNDRDRREVAGLVADPEHAD